MTLTGTFMDVMMTLLKFRHEEEVEAYSKAIECNEKDAFLYYQRASIYYYFLKDHVNAKKDVVVSLKMDPSRSYSKQLLEKLDKELNEMGC